jgi:hypothetical protein
MLSINDGKMVSQTNSARSMRLKLARQAAQA